MEEGREEGHTINKTMKKTQQLWAVAEKAMANHSRTLAWKIPWTAEPGGLQSMGLRSVGHN